MPRLTFAAAVSRPAVVPEVAALVPSQRWPTGAELVILEKRVRMTERKRLKALPGNKKRSRAGTLRAAVKGEGGGGRGEQNADSIPGKKRFR